MEALRVGSIVRLSMEESVNVSRSIIADLEELRSKFLTERDITSETLRGEIAMLKQGCLASISRYHGNFQGGFRALGDIIRGLAPVKWGSSGKGKHNPNPKERF
jgi:hypothetical protein